jgi:hypothetical protein
MLAKIFDMEESKGYDNLTAEQVLKISTGSQKLSPYETFHTKKEHYDSSTHVKVRLLYNDKLDIDFLTGKL